MFAMFVAVLFGVLGALWLWSHRDDWGDWWTTIWVFGLIIGIPVALIGGVVLLIVMNQ